jgi:hypothetical protein
MNQSKTKKLVKYFGKKEVTIIEKDNQLWMTAEEIGKALGYSEPRIAVLKIFKRHRDILESFSGVTNLVTPGGKQDVTIFNESGCYIIAMKSNTRLAKDFVVWAAKIISAYRQGLLVKKETKPKLPSATFLREIRESTGETFAGIYLRDTIGIPLPPNVIVQNCIRTIGLADGYVAKMFEYDSAARMYLEINTGKFAKKDALAAMLGLTVNQIWGER